MKVTVVLVLFIFLVNALLKAWYYRVFLFSIVIAVGLTLNFCPWSCPSLWQKDPFRWKRRYCKAPSCYTLTSVAWKSYVPIRQAQLPKDKIKLAYVDLNGAHPNRFRTGLFKQTGIKIHWIDDAIFKKIDITGNNKVDEIPFDFYRKANGGSLQKIKTSSSYVRSTGRDTKSCTISQNGKECSNTIYDALSSDGFRVLAIAIKHIEHKLRYSKWMNPIWTLSDSLPFRIHQKKMSTKMAMILPA